MDIADQVEGALVFLAIARKLLDLDLGLVPFFRCREEINPVEPFLPQSWKRILQRGQLFLQRFDGQIVWYPREKRGKPG